LVFLPFCCFDCQCQAEMSFRNEALPGSFQTNRIAGSPDCRLVFVTALVSWDGNTLY
uniref:Uncharacterized protein n=1 Tax=Junco hyemalis TaxID=40217 RepID=A0A8C5JFJ1_JUNHY